MTTTSLDELSSRMHEVTGFHRMRCVRELGRLGVWDHEDFVKHLEGLGSDVNFEGDEAWRRIVDEFLSGRQRRYRETMPGVFVLKGKP